MALEIRAMTEREFEHWQGVLAEEYAAQQVAAGRWAADGAVDRAHQENAELLPQGIETPRMLFLSAVDGDEPVGRAWVSLDHPRGAPDCAFLYDIEIDERFRGRGWGAQLLSAAEAAAAEAGLPKLELNVFGGNRAAISLYSRAGYDVVTQQMRKSLSPRESR